MSTCGITHTLETYDASEQCAKYVLITKNVFILLE